MMKHTGKIRKKVVFILPNLNGGGAERTTLNVLRYLDQQKYKITLFLFKKKGVYWSELPAHIQVVYGEEKHHSFPVFLFKVMVNLLRVIYRSDLVVAALESWPTYFGVGLGWLCRKKTIAWVCTDLTKFFKQSKVHYMLCRVFYRLASRIVCVSKGTQKVFKELIQKSAPTLQIYNILDKRMLFEKAAQELAQPLLKYSKEKFICAVGRLDPFKGFDLLIRAYAELKSMGHEEKLVIIGEGGERPKLEKLIADLNLQNDICLTGFLHNAPALLKLASLFILPSLSEALGGVLLEAMALQVPIVVSDCPPGGVREVLQESEVCGLLFENKNIQQLVEKMDFALKNVLQMKEMTEKALRRTEDFSYIHIIPQWEYLMDQLLS